MRFACLRKMVLFIFLDFTCMLFTYSCHQSQSPADGSDAENDTIEDGTDSAQMMVMRAVYSMRKIRS